MAFRNVAGPALRSYTTAQLDAVTASYGPTGTSQVNGIKPGILVFDTTEVKVKVFDGTAFVALA